MEQNNSRNNVTENSSGVTSFLGALEASGIRDPLLDLINNYQAPDEEPETIPEDELMKMIIESEVDSEDANPSSCKGDV